MEDSSHGGDRHGWLLHGGDSSLDDSSLDDSSMEDYSVEDYSVVSLERMDDHKTRSTGQRSRGAGGLCFVGRWVGQNSEDKLVCDLRSHSMYSSRDS